MKRSLLSSVPHCFFCYVMEKRKEEKKNEGKGRKDVKVGRKRRMKCEGRKK